jgi:uncharacterized protein (DUF486 family)
MINYLLVVKVSARPTPCAPCFSFRLCSSPPLHANLTPNLEAVISTDTIYRAALLLVCSNVFMTFAWYAHLRDLAHRPWWIAALVSWGIALFEYLLQVPANRIGYTALSLAQLKILQEVVTLAVFVPFAVLYMREPIKLDYVWAALCLMGAVYFIFRSHG